MSDIFQLEFKPWKLIFQTVKNTHEKQIKVFFNETIYIQPHNCSI